MTPDGAVIQRCPNDKSSGGARLPASPAPDGIIMENWQPNLRASSAVSGRLDMPRVVECSLQSGRVVEQACGEPRRPRGARTGDRYQQEAVRGSRQRDKAAAGQALGRKQHHVQDQPRLRRRERRARRKAGQVQPHRTAPRDKAGREALQGVQVQRFGVLAPGGAQQLQPLSQFDRGQLRECQGVAVGILLARDLQHANQRTQRPRQVMAEPGAEQFSEAQNIVHAGRRPLLTQGRHVSAEIIHT